MQLVAQTVADLRKISLAIHPPKNACSEQEREQKLEDIEEGFHTYGVFFVLLRWRKPRLAQIVAARERTDLAPQKYK